MNRSRLARIALLLITALGVFGFDDIIKLMVPSELPDWLVRFGAALIAAIGIMDGLFGFLDIGGKDKANNRTNNVSPNAPLFDVSVQSQSEKLIGREKLLRELVDLLAPANILL